jgi:hypothetical protein
MKTVTIEEVGIGPDSRLYVKASLAPSADYSFIWRDATSVRWDEKNRRLYVLPVKGFSPVDDYRQILAAVLGEYGDRLVLAQSTIFLDVPQELASELRKTQI